jgi:L-lactate utilization protein LutB
VNGELKARIARAKAIIAAMSGDSDPTEAELSTIGGSFTTYLQQFAGQLTLNGNAKKVGKLAKKAAKAIKKVAKAKAGKKLDKAKTKASAALDAFDAMVAAQA